MSLRYGTRPDRHSLDLERYVCMIRVRVKMTRGSQLLSGPSNIKQGVGLTTHGPTPRSFTAKELWNDDATRPERKLMILSLTAVIH